MEKAVLIVLSGIGALVLTLIAFWILRKMKGSITITPEKYNYAPGETIKGKILLKLKKPITADQLIIGLRCQRTERSTSLNTGKSQPSTSNIFDFNQPLEGKKDYAPSEYPYDFAITIPQNVSPQLEGIAGSLVKSASILMGQNASLRWYLYAELECDGVNLSKEIQVNVAG